jgi:ferric-chelate reductase
LCSSSNLSLICVIDHISWISEALGSATKMAPTGLEISIQIYVTGGIVSQQLDNASIKSEKGIHETEEEGCLPSLFEDPTVQITTGSRPSLKYILQNEAGFTARRMGVVGLYYCLSTNSCCSLILRTTTVCGSRSITSAVKDALGFPIAGPSTIMKGGPSITLHMEAFGYA